MKKLKFYRIYWRDATSDSSWRSYREVLEFAEKNYSQPCESNGYLVGQNDKYIVLCGSRDNFGDFGETIVIPKVLITKKLLLNEDVFNRLHKKRR